MNKLVFQSHLFTTKCIIVFVCNILFLSCSQKFGIYHSNLLFMDMSITEANNLVLLPPIAEFDISIEQPKPHKYYVQVYIYYEHKQEFEYFVFFDDGKLRYWGFPYEFERHSDYIINEIGRKAKIKYMSIK